MSVFMRLCDLINMKISAQPEIFQGRGDFLKLGHFNKYFVKKSRKNVPQEKNLEFFLIDTLETTF